MLERPPFDLDFEAKRARAVLDARLFGTGGATTLGRYALRTVIGAGGSGTIYVAFDPRLRRDVAVKVWSSQEPASTRALLHEARALARVRHRNVVTVHDVGTFDGGRAFVVMELIRGQTLHAWSNTPRSVAAVLTVLIGIARGLHAAHLAGVVHRDVTPTNVLVDADGTAFLVDFGLSTSGPETTVAGTPGFVAPEVLAGEADDARSDQYGFGRVALDVLDRSGARAPRWLLRIVGRATADRPRDRWPTLADLLRSIARRRRATRAAVFALGAAAVFGASWVGASWQATSPAELNCTDSPWTAEARSTVSTPSGEGPLDHGPATRWAVERLDAYASSWAAACAAAETNRNAVAQTCLRQRRSELATTLDVLTSGNRPGSTHVMELVGALRPVQGCADAHGDGAFAPLSPELTRAEVLRRAGRYDESIAIATRVQESAHQQGNGVDELGARTHISEVLSERAEYDEAERVLLEALWRAEALGSDRVKAEVATSLAFVELQRRSRSPKAAQWIAIAQEATEHLGNAPWLVARIHQMRGKYAYAGGDYVAAESEARSAIALLEPTVGRVHLTPLGAHEDLGAALFMQGRNEEALASFDLVYEIKRDVFGDDHPIAARALAKRAAALWSLGDDDAAVESFEHAGAVLAANAPDTLARSNVHQGLAWSLMEVGQTDEAEAEARKAIELAEGAPISRAAGWGVLGQVQRRLLRPQEAIDAFERNIAFWDAHNRLHPNAAVARMGLGLTLLDVERPADAIAPLRVAIEALATTEADPETLADAQFLLARAIWSSGGDRPEARELAVAAKQGYLERCDEPCDGWREMDAWLGATADAV